ncbi:MAG: hypothetical protein WA813_10830 [Beijerinckiaceae bacterium]
MQAANISMGCDLSGPGDIKLEDATGALRNVITKLALDADVDIAPITAVCRQ